MDVPRGMLVGTLHIFDKHFDQLDKVKFEQRYETNIYLAKIVDTKKGVLQLQTKWFPLHIVLIHFSTTRLQLKCIIFVYTHRQGWYIVHSVNISTYLTTATQLF